MARYKTPLKRAKRCGECSKDEIIIGLFSLVQLSAHGDGVVHNQQNNAARARCKPVADEPRSGDVAARLTRTSFGEAISYASKMRVMQAAHKPGCRRRACCELSRMLSKTYPHYYLRHMGSSSQNWISKHVARIFGCRRLRMALPVCLLFIILFSFTR